MCSDQRLLTAKDAARAATAAAVSGVTVRAARLHLVAPDLAAHVAAPAFDAVSPRERKRIAQRNPGNFLNRVRALPAAAADDEREAVLRDNARALQAMVAEGVFRAWPSPAVGLYRLSDDRHVQTGFVAAVAVRDYEEERILPHELTHPDREALLARYLDAVGVVSSPVALAYRNRPALAGVAAQIADDPPVLDFTADDGVQQAVWMVDDPAGIAAIEHGFAETAPLYVTDGHHRLAAAARHARLRRGGAPVSDGAPWEFFLAVLFPDDELRAESFNRCVRLPPGRSADDLLAALEHRVAVRRLGRPPRLRSTPATRSEPAPRQFAMFLEGDWYLLDVGAVDAPTPDAALLQDLVLRPVLGIDDPRSDPRIDHLPGAADVAALEDRCRDTGEAAFLLNAPTMAELMAVSDAGMVMPPKSTWFHPKARAGIFLRSVT